MKKLIILACLLLPSLIRADEKMASYILDGSLVIYSVSLKETAKVIKQFFQKFEGIEGSKNLSLWQSAIRERIGVNIIDPVEAASIGIDPQGSVAYVHLSAAKGYVIFTVKNKDLLAHTLDQLPQPMPYRILEDSYVLFSTSLEILDYQNFQGLPVIPAFKTAAKALAFNWKQNFIWLSGTYLKEKSTINPGQYVFPDGDRMGIVVNIDEDKLTFDAYTVYQDQTVREALEKSMMPLNEQRLSLLDFESGKPAIVGQAYIHMPSFLENITLIDKAEVLGLRRIFAQLEKNDINLKDRLFPYLKGRLSYVIRAYEPLRKNYNATFIAGVSDETRVREFLSMLKVSAEKAGLKVGRKSLFTREFYSFPMRACTLWLGTVEGSLILSTSESNLNVLIKNIYENNSGFLQTLPPTFARGVRAKIYGGQNYIYVPQFIQGVRPDILPELLQVLLPFETVEWSYYLQKVDGEAGRRDTITGRFFKKRR